MPATDRPITLATRGSALALAQTNMVLAQCRVSFPDLHFEVKIIKTTGDKLQTAPPDLPALPGTKGLFTKELEVALLNGEADFAVHSLKDLPTDLPEGLTLCAVLPRADARDVLIYRDAENLKETSESGLGIKRGLRAGATLADFPAGATIATSSTRRHAQLLAIRPDLKVVPIRGNVGTRLSKLAELPELDGIVLAAAGLKRLHFQISAEGNLTTSFSSDAASQVPKGLRATFLSIEEMIPCVGQGAIGIEGRIGDSQFTKVFDRLNDLATLQCVTAERAFLKGMGGGCLSPVAAYAEKFDGHIRLRAVSFRTDAVKRGEQVASANEAAELGARVAKELQ